MPNNLESQQTSFLDKRVTRRGFIKGTALGVVGLAGLRYLPAAAQSGSETAAPAVELEPLSGWGSLPIVEGEPAVEGRVVMPEAGVLSIDVGMNSREKNTTTGTTPTRRDAGTYVEVSLGEEDMTDAEGDPRYMWTGGNIVQDPVNGVFSDPSLREHIYVANNIGNTTLLTQPDQLPIGLQNLYRSAGEIPDSTVQIAAATLPSVFEKFGGDVPFSEKVAKAWGVTTTVDKTFEEQAGESPIRAWQYGVSIAAQGISEENVSGAVNLSDIIDGTDLSFYRVVKGNIVDVISRASNTEDTESQDLFVVTRQVTDEKGEVSIQNVGFTTAEGLNHAYQNAAEIAKSLSALSGKGVVDLVQQINGLDQSAVYLPGMDAFAPKIATQENETVAYQREGSSYQALSTVVTESGEEITKGRVAIQTEEGVDWLADLEFDQFSGDLINEYSAKYNISREALFEAVTIESFTDKDGNPYLVAVHGDVPLMVVDRDKNGELGWTESTLRFLAEKKGIRVGTTATYWKDAKHQALAEKEFNTWMTENDLIWAKIEPQFKGTLDSRRVNHVLQQLGQAERAGIDFIGHGPFAWGVYPEHSSVDGMKDLMKELFTTFPKIREWNLLREVHPLEWHEDKLLSELIGQLGSEQAARQKLPQLVAEAAATAKEELVAEGVEVGEIITSYSDNNNQTLAGATHQMSKDAAQYFDKAGCHFHAEGDKFPTEQEIIEGLRDLAGVTKKGKVMVTELDINMRNVGGSAEQREAIQAELYERVYKAAIKSGVCDTVTAFLTLADNESWLEMENVAGNRYSPNADPTMFDDNRKRKQSYFRVSSALLNTSV